ncbi:hypothetical protein AYY17_14610 [Morganella psychrotolerans]|uniref:Uncharacterized protein n=1 Tax=Morganella psychrotolerans TaxID=368603 RepID=A0A1B8HN37_9GAMM|nr:hypothetical protein AYY17_14610 [Morganella psychrotolerans]
MAIIYILIHSYLIPSVGHIIYLCLPSLAARQLKKQKNRHTSVYSGFVTDMTLLYSLFSYC